jgi:hypothetical protein
MCASSDALRSASGGFFCAIVTSFDCFMSKPNVAPKAATA